jgi:hypothetical protein
MRNTWLGIAAGLILVTHAAASGPALETSFYTAWSGGTPYMSSSGATLTDGTMYGVPPSTFFISTGQAMADFGALRAASTAVLSGGTSAQPAVHDVSTSARYRDIITITPGPSVTVDSGNLVLHFNITGSTAANEHGQAGGSLEVLAHGQMSLGFFPVSGLEINQSVSTSPIPYEWGDPLPIQVTLSAWNSIQNPFTGAFDANALADFYNTVQFTGLSLSDKNGAITDFTVTYASPEPNLALLLGPAAMLLRRRPRCS